MQHIPIIQFASIFGYKLLSWSIQSRSVTMEISWESFKQGEKDLLFLHNHNKHWNYLQLNPVIRVQWRCTIQSLQSHVGNGTLDRYNCNGNTKKKKGPTRKKKRKTDNILILMHKRPIYHYIIPKIKRKKEKRKSKPTGKMHKECITSKSPLAINLI